MKLDQNMWRYNTIWTWWKISNDDYRIHGKVTVENDFGKTSYTEGWTKGTGKGGNHIHADIEKGINVPGLKLIFKL